MLHYTYELKRTKPCPFCGGGKIVAGYSTTRDENGQIFFAACKKCEAQTKPLFVSVEESYVIGEPDAETENELVKLWNMRFHERGE